MIARVSRRVLFYTLNLGTRRDTTSVRNIENINVFLHDSARLLTRAFLCSEFWARVGRRAPALNF